MSLLNSHSDPTQAEEVYTKLKMDLMVGVLSPSRKLSIRSVAEDLGAGTSPVREALKRLASERILDGGAKRSYVVPNLGDSRAVDLFNLRALLECEAAALALPRLGPSHLPILRDAAELMGEALMSGQLDNYMVENLRFHFQIYNRCGSNDMIAIIEQLWMQTGPSLRRGMHSAAYDISWNSSHLNIIAALETRDINAMRQEMLRDIGWGAEHYAQY